MKISSSPSSFAILVDANGKSIGVSLFDQVVGKVAVASHTRSSHWFLAGQTDESSPNYEGSLLRWISESY